MKQNNNKRNPEIYNQEKVQMSAKELQLKKDRVRIPARINEKIATFVQHEKDVWSVLQKNLDNSHYGGMYMKDNTLHIKALKEDEVQKTLHSIFAYVPEKFQSAKDGIVLEYDAKYSMAQLNQAVENFIDCNKWAELGILGLGKDEELNGFFVESENWTQEKKDAVQQILGIDMNHLRFDTIAKSETIDSPTAENQEKKYHPDSNEGNPGKSIRNRSTPPDGKCTLGAGIYYEVMGVSQGNGDYGWITCGHGNESGHQFRLETRYDYILGNVDFNNVGEIPGKTYGCADVGIIYKTSNSEVVFSLETTNGEVVMNTGHAIQGEYLDALGAVNPQTRGKVESADYTVPWESDDTLYRWMIKVSGMQLIKGDSGAPLLRELGGNRYTLLGIYKGRTTYGGTLSNIFTDWSSIQDILYHPYEDNKSVEVWLWP